MVPGLFASAEVATAKVIHSLRKRTIKAERDSAILGKRLGVVRGRGRRRNCPSIISGRFLIALAFEQTPQFNVSPVEFTSLGATVHQIIEGEYLSPPGPRVPEGDFEPTEHLLRRVSGSSNRDGTMRNHAVYHRS